MSPKADKALKSSQNAAGTGTAATDTASRRIPPLFCPNVSRKLSVVLAESAVNVALNKVQFRLFSGSLPAFELAIDCETNALVP